MSNTIFWEISPWKEDQGALAPVYRNYPYRLLKLKAIIHILIMKSLWLSFWKNFKILHFDASWTCTFSSTFGKRIVSITHTLTMPESKYHNSLMERKPAVNMLGSYIWAIMVCYWKNVTFSIIWKSTEVFKQMEQMNSNSTSFA